MKIYVSYAWSKNRMEFGNGAADVEVDREPTCYADVLAVARDIERHHSFSEIIVLNWRKYAALTLPVALTLACLALPARADDLRVPPGFLLCHTAEDIARPDHAGCWLARGGQKVERINPAVTWSQIVVRSTDGSETSVVYALKADADQLQGGRR